MGTARTAASTAPARTATGNGTPNLLATNPVAYAEVPQKAAWPKDIRPVKPSRRSIETAKSAQHRMSTATAGYSPLGSQSAMPTPMASRAYRNHGGAADTASRPERGADTGGAVGVAGAVVDVSLMPATPPVRTDQPAARAARRPSR
jgi:hypothetical protein